MIKRPHQFSARIPSGTPLLFPMVGARTAASHLTLCPSTLEGEAELIFQFFALHPLLVLWKGAIKRGFLDTFPTWNVECDFACAREGESGVF